MKKSKLKSALLILSAIILSVIVFACGANPENEGVLNVNDEDAAQNRDASGENDVQSEEEETESGNSIEERPDYELPERNLGGYDFRILSRSEAANIHWWNYDISVEEESGDPIDDAVFRRNQKVEELYNINIVNIPNNSVGSTASRSIRAGSDDYDIVVIGLRDGQESLMTDGHLSDLNAVPNIDLTRPWWDQKAVEQLSINNKLFATACDLTVRDKDAIIILMFNKQLMRDYELGDIYSLVSSGKWTLDKMHEMMRTVSRDITGDGAMGLDDQYGLLSQYRHSEYLFNAAGEYISKLNAQKIPEITVYNERAALVSDKIAEMQGDRNITMHAEQGSGVAADIWDGFQVPFFAEGRALFYHAGMNRVALLRTMEQDFGILPPPKFDENQENYHAAVDAWCMSAVSVPITADKDKAGLILETLAYESRYILLPAYYDVNLKTKFARDEESSAMIDIILNNRLYDLGDIFYWGNAVQFFENLSQGRGDSLATYWERDRDRVASAMDRTLERLDNVE